MIIQSILWVNGNTSSFKRKIWRHLSELLVVFMVGFPANKIVSIANNFRTTIIIPTKEMES